MSPQPASSPGFQPNPKRRATTIIFALLAAIVVIDLIVISYVFFSSKTGSRIIRPAHAAVISGHLDINGYLPANAYVEIQQKKQDANAFTLATIIASPTDGGSWIWDTATENTLYSLKAVAKVANSVIAESDILTAAAPADGEILRIVSGAAPPSPTSTAGFLSASQTSVLSGSMDINGYIPSGATITITAQPQGGSVVPIVANLKAADTAVWSWSGATLGTLYTIQATLFSGGTAIGTSPLLSMAAPSQNEIITINSIAAAPAVSGVISGILNINGTPPPGASIVLATRVSNTPQFLPVASDIVPIDGNAWSWTAPKAGVSYDILAYLMVNGSPVFQSQLLVVRSPAQNEKLTINIASRPPAPLTNSINSTCVGKNSNNQWQVTLGYNNNRANPGAQQFIIQIGTSTNDASVLNSTFVPPNPAEAQTYTTGYLLNEKQTYYARYAYSTCANCTDINSFSQFSVPFAFDCATQPTPTATPTVTPTPTPMPTPTATPTPTPMISQCNESCGGSGYTCVAGLECTAIGSGLGANSCRNPSCPTEPLCVCP